MDVVELASGVCPTRDLIDPGMAVQVVQSGIGVGLQRSGVVLQMPTRMFSLAILRVCEPDCRSSGLGGRPVIAHIGPEAPCLGLAVTRREYGNRCVVGVDLRCRQNMLPDLIDQRRDEFTCCADPSGQCRAVKIDTFPGVALRLSVKWL